MKNWKISFGKIVDQDDKVICGLPKRENNDAAHLISAAPDLLSALERAEAALSWFINDEGECDIEALDEAKAAIAKAKGESK
jgi:hypothetical protein